MNQGNNPDAPSADVPLKRKRGRPRKHPSINRVVNARFPRDHILNFAEHGYVPKDQKLNHGGHVRGPPGFQGMNGQQPCPVEPNAGAVDPMVGQIVAGVIEASFDDGYLLNVRVGNSGTTLRGVVFKPGHYVPVSVENDVAPHARVIRRHEVPLPTESYARAHGSHRNGTYHGTSLVSTKGKQVSSVANPAMSRGNVVPVVLQPMDQPIDLSNGLPIANQPSPVLSQTALPFSSKAKAKAHLYEPQATQQEVPKAATQNDNSAANGVPQVLHNTEMKSLEMSGMPMEKLLAEVIRRGQGRPQSAPMKDTSTYGNIDQPLSIEPLQSVQPHQHNASAARPCEKERIGRMTELLQVVQERVTENQPPRVADQVASTLPNVDQPRMPEKGGDDEAVH